MNQRSIKDARDDCRRTVTSAGTCGWSKRLRLLLLLFLIPVPSVVAADPRPDTLLVMFWNVENFFHYKSEGRGGSEEEFSSFGSRHWTRRRYLRKCNAIAKTILAAAAAGTERAEREAEAAGAAAAERAEQAAGMEGEARAEGAVRAAAVGRLPDAVGFAEVENRKALTGLLRETILRKTDYAIVHFDSPDRRGIDCALLYRPSTLGEVRAEAKHLYDSAGTVIPTRDILVAVFDSIAILVNHHPSKVGSAGGSGRSVAMARMDALVDSLARAGCRRILCIGDFNDDVWRNGADPGVVRSRRAQPGNDGPSNAPQAPAKSPPSHSSSRGTIKYNGEWEKIDGCFYRGPGTAEETVLAFPFLLEEDRAYGGVKPRRTYSGPRWKGGVSDHLPICVSIAP